MLVRDDSVDGLNVNWGRESTQKFLSVVISEKAMTVQFLIRDCGTMGLCLPRRRTNRCPVTIRSAVITHE